jgi:hypothetical protein
MWTTPKSPALTARLRVAPASYRVSTGRAHDGAASVRISFSVDEMIKATGLSRTRIFQAIPEGKLISRKDGKARIVEIDEARRYVRSLPTQ